MDRILIEAGPGETRVALLDGAWLRELLIDRPGHGSVVGNVYLGRVERVLPGIAAAFVDIGIGRAGFLGLAEARPPDHGAGDPAALPADRITDYVTEGDAVLVQVQRDPAPDKGAKLTTHVALTGRRAVLMPGTREIRLSKRIDGDEERARLEEIVRGALGDGEGAILRTAASGMEAGDLTADLEALRGLWADIRERRTGANAPVCLHREPGAAKRALRDAAGAALREAVVEGPGALAELRAWCEGLSPELVAKLRAHGEDGPLFEAFGIEEQVDAALAPRVPLPSGGSLIIQQTAALVAIDVNTGGRPESGGPEDAALRANLEAADEIARQLRLRNLSGTVVVDFVPMRRRQNTAEVLARLRAGVADDKVATHVFGQTKLGLVEMTRQRRSESLGELMGAACPACHGGGRVRGPLTLAFEALRRALRAQKAAPGAAVEVVAGPAVIEALRGEASGALAETEAALGAKLELTADPACAADGLEIVTAKRGRNGNG